MKMNKNRNDLEMSSHGHPDGSMQNMQNQMPNNRHMMMMMMMNMQSNSGTFSLMTKSDFLIEGINIASVEGIILAMVFTMIITISNDMLKVVLNQWQREGADKSANKRKKEIVLLVKTFIHMTSVLFAYITMLCVMTMNVWLMISFVCGSGIAHLLIRPFLYTKLRNHYAKTERSNVKEEVELLHEDYESSAEKKQCCKANNIVATARLITDTNND